MPAIEPDLTDQHVLAELGRRARELRLARNETQAALAESAGVSRHTVVRFEDGAAVNVTALVRIVRALGLMGRLDQLIPDPDESPLRELAAQETGRRQRASGPKQTGPSDNDDDFRWGTT